MCVMLECAGFIPQVKLVKKAFDAQRGIIVLASKSQKPSMVRISVVITSQESNTFIKI